MTEQEVQDLPKGSLVAVIDNPNPEQNRPHIVGQGKSPAAFTVTVNGKTYRFTWGLVGQLSQSCDKENKIANMDASGYPLFRREFVAENAQMLRLEQKADEEETTTTDSTTSS